MKILYGLLVSLALAGGPAMADPAAPPAPPATPDPGDVSQPNGMIRDLYTRYYAATMATEKEGVTMPPELDWAAIADKYFTTELATRFKKAIASDEPVIDWDFFINGQDFGDLKVLSVDTTMTDARTASVMVKTSNFGNESTTLVSMVSGIQGWRIADMAFVGGEPEGMSLSSVLKDAGY